MEKIIHNSYLMKMNIYNIRATFHRSMNLPFGEELNDFCFPDIWFHKYAFGISFFPYLIPSLLVSVPLGLGWINLK